MAVVLTLVVTARTWRTSWTRGKYVFSYNFRDEPTESLSNKFYRVDSDNDNRARHQAFGGGAQGDSSYNNPSSTAGPHNSNLTNKLDPRVDSDLDNRATLGTQR